MNSVNLSSPGRRASRLTGVSTEVYNTLKAKGYKHLGDGIEQVAFAEPGTGLVLKIFPSGKKNSGVSSNQQIFIQWADFCMRPENKRNRFLPHFYGWSKFIVDGETYLQIRTERLFPANTDSGQYFGNFLQDMVHDARYRPFKDSDLKPNGIIAKLVMLVGGEKQFKELWNTIFKVAQFGREHGLSLDLHSDNFMLGSDGNPVINDPFFGKNGDGYYSSFYSG